MFMGKKPKQIHTQFDHNKNRELKYIHSTTKNEPATQITTRRKKKYEKDSKFKYFQIKLTN